MIDVTVSQAPASLRGNRLIQGFLNILGRLIAGRLTVVLPDGATYELTSNATTRPHAVIRVHRWRALRRLTTRGEACIRTFRICMPIGVNFSFWLPRVTVIVPVSNCRSSTRNTSGLTRPC